jgi:hypothetical protein
MAARLRIARLDASLYVPLAPDGAATADLHRRLRTFIRRHLPPVNASLLAAPAPTSDGRFFDWYSDLAGQPVTLQALPESEKAAASRLLNDRLESIKALADRLPPEEPEAATLAADLRRALSYPGDENVYVVGGQPVLTFWGYRNVSGSPPAGLPLAPAAGVTVAAHTPADTGLPEKRRRGLPLSPWLLWAPLLVAALAFVAFWYARDFRWPPWIDEAALYQAAVREEADLRRGIAGLETKLRARTRLCALEGELDAARREEQALQQQAASLISRLAQERELCPLKKRLQVAEAEGQTLRQRVAELGQTLRDCRQEASRVKKCLAEYQGEVVILFDASLSMGFNFDLDPAVEDRLVKLLASKNLFNRARGQDLFRQLERSPGVNRIDVAKQALIDGVKATNENVSFSLVSFNRCGPPKYRGRYPNERRVELIDRIRNLDLDISTALARALIDLPRYTKGGQSPQHPVDIILVSDGQDTCNGDPCAAAARVNKQLPHARIHVITIGRRLQELRCIADTTGGAFLQPKNIEQLSKYLSEITSGTAQRLCMARPE